jgi:hypothetical protein
MEMFVPDRPIQRPRVMGDIEAYQSPVSGEWVEGRRARRYDLEKHDCVEAPPRKRRGYRNPAFCKRFGLPLTQD